jgi:hypothetical protein
LVAGIAISAGHSRYQAGRMKCVLTAEGSLLTIVLRLVSHKERILVIAKDPCMEIARAFRGFTRRSKNE